MYLTHLQSAVVSSIASLRDKPNYYSQKQQLPGIKKDLVKVGHSGELLDFSRVDASVLQAVSKIVLNYWNEIIFTDCDIRDYWDEQYFLKVDRDINAAINLKRLGP